jgi:hypothetical protein
MTLKAQQFRWPFILLITMILVPVFAHLWVFLREADFTAHAFLSLFETFGVCFILGGYLVMYLKIGQSVELTDDGIWSLVWVKPTKAKMWPSLERKILNWTDMQKWKMSGSLIYLYGSQHRVVINTFLFKDGNEVIKFINKATKADN